MNSDLQFLMNTNIEPSMAREIHIHFIPSIKLSIQKDKDFIESVKLKTEDSDVIKEVEGLFLQKINEAEQTLAHFVDKWPYPKVTKHDDDVLIYKGAADLPKEAAIAEFSQSLPHEDFIYHIVGSAQQSAIFVCESKVTGNFYKVPNMSYNRPNERESCEWVY